MSLLIKSSIPAKVAACDKLSVEENKTLEKIKASARKLDSVVSSRSFAQVPRALSDLYDALKEQVIFAHGKYFLIGKMKDIEPSLKKGLTAKDKDPYINDVFKLCKEVSAYLSQMFARADRLNAEDAVEKLAQDSAITAMFQPLADAQAELRAGNKKSNVKNVLAAALAAAEKEFKANPFYTSRDKRIIDDAKKVLAQFDAAEAGDAGAPKFHAGEKVYTIHKGERQPDMTIIRPLTEKESPLVDKRVIMYKCRTQSGIEAWVEEQNLHKA